MRQRSESEEVERARNMKWNGPKTVNDKRGLNGKKLTERGRSGLWLRQRGQEVILPNLVFRFYYIY